MDAANREPDMADHGSDAPLRTVTYQGVPGAFSYEACGQAEPDLYAVPCASFEEVLLAVREGRAERALIPIENSTFGRVADIHRLLPKSGLHIVAEHFMSIQLQLLARPGASLSDIKTAQSHPVALGQCRLFLLEHGIEAIPVADTAAAAADVARQGDPSKGAIASDSAGAIYGLHSVAAGIQDDKHNTTRFLVMAREPIELECRTKPMITSFVFVVRNVPAALYKALGGFATAGVNVVKIESYMMEGSFSTVQFYVEVEGHPEEERVQIAIDELRYYCSHTRILGVYPAHPYRSRRG
jgi:prephenate dehydratase